eukprot:scaffold2058_cov403-Prasinococcus_capsulatus_cf.AAC.3
MPVYRGTGAEELAARPDTYNHGNGGFQHATTGQSSQLKSHDGDDDDDDDYESESSDEEYVDASRGLVKKVRWLGMRPATFMLTMWACCLMFGFTASQTMGNDWFQEVKETRGALLHVLGYFGVPGLQVYVMATPPTSLSGSLGSTSLSDLQAVEANQIEQTLSSPSLPRRDSDELGDLSLIKSANVGAKDLKPRPDLSGTFHDPSHLEVHVEPNLGSSSGDVREHISDGVDTTEASNCHVRISHILVKFQGVKTPKPTTPARQAAIACFVPSPSDVTLPPPCLVMEGSKGHQDCQEIERGGEGKDYGVRTDAARG